MLVSAQVDPERMILSLTEEASKPSHELTHSTNRFDKLTDYERALEIPNGQPIPLLMSYGVGGAGKKPALEDCLNLQLEITLKPVPLHNQSFR